MLNLDLTVAVTHNYCASSNFDAVWRHTRRGRPKLSVKWLAALAQVCAAASPPRHQYLCRIFQRMRIAATGHYYRGVGTVEFRTAAITIQSDIMLTS